MTEAIEQLKSFRKRRDELEQEIQSTGKQLFREAVEMIFNEHPGLVAFSWTQYTPYFNDGDECVFSANTDYLDIQFGDEEELKAYYASSSAPASGKHEADKAVKNFLRLFDDDDYKAMFGDHIKVIVTKGDSIKIEVEGYNHD